MSPTAPTFVTLTNQLNQAHRRIRELEARETELVAHNRTLCAVIEELTNDDHPHTAELASWSNDGSDGIGIGNHPGKPTSQRLGKPPSQPPAESPASAGASGAETDRAKTAWCHHV